LLIVAVDLNGILQIISGTYMIHAIFKIKAFFDRQEASNELNLVVMILQGSAFGLYLLADLLYYVLRTLYFIKSSRIEMLNTSITVYLWMNFVAQLLLIAIFWDLGKPLEEVREDTMDSTPIIEDFDDEAEMMARIWNTFQKDEDSASIVLHGSIAQFN